MGPSEEFIGSIEGGGWIVSGFLVALAVFGGGFVVGHAWECLGHRFFPLCDFTARFIALRQSSFDGLVPGTNWLQRCFPIRQM